MGLTGIFLILFLIIHVSLNATIWANDGGKMFTDGAHFMGSSVIPRILEIGLVIGFLLHIIQGFALIVLSCINTTLGSYGVRPSWRILKTKCFYLVA